MPAWPYGFDGKAMQRVSGKALERLASDNTWNGRDVGRQQDFVQEFTATGETVYGSKRTFFSGKAFADRDVLCEQFEGFLWGRALCGPVYLNPQGSAADGNQFYYVNPPTYRTFSPRHQPQVRP